MGETALELRTYPFEFWVCPIKPGKILYEMEGVDETLAREAFDLAASKIPVSTSFIKRI